MIRTLRTRLVAAAMLSLLVVLTVILGVILLGSYRGIVSDADRILDLLAEGEGTFPTLPADFNWEEEGPRRRSPELGYEIRYFSVLLDVHLPIHAVYRALGVGGGAAGSVSPVAPPLPADHPPHSGELRKAEAVHHRRRSRAENPHRHHPGGHRRADSGDRGGQ